MSLIFFHALTLPVRAIRRLIAPRMTWHEVRPGVFYSGKYKIVGLADDNFALFIDGGFIGKETTERRAKRHFDWVNHRANRPTGKGRGNG